jgi:hypothetical protein
MTYQPPIETYMDWEPWANREITNRQYAAKGNLHSGHEWLGERKKERKKRKPAPNFDFGKL